jgi:hypothetical protein
VILHMRGKENYMETLRGLKSVRVSKGFLLEKLETNKVEHEKAYYQILDARQDKVVEVLKEELKKAKADRTYQPTLYVPLPENHVKDYERAITILNASLDKEFELTSSEFDQYVNDDWQWKTTFMTTSGCYIPMTK